MKKSFERIMSDAKYSAKKYSPEILLGIGVVGIITGTVFACKATTKVSSVLETYEKQKDDVAECLANEEIEYTQEDADKDYVTINSKTALEFVKLYAPSVTVMGISVACILGSHSIIKKRNIALSAAYSTVDVAFKEYKRRVENKYGKEAERKIRYNIKDEEIEEEVVDEKGKTKIVKKTVEKCDLTIDEKTDFRRFFESGNPNWEPSLEYNLMYLKGQQNYWNDVLVRRGRVFLSDIYSALGYEETKASRIVGWVYDPENPNIASFIDFGLDVVPFDTENPTILLDFNFDGDILCKM